MIQYDKAAVIILVIAGAVLFAQAFIGMALPAETFGHTEEKYERFVSAELEGGKCEVPEGYSEEAWAEHMSHHPDRYEECL